MDRLVAVDPERTRANLRRDPVGATDVTGPDRACKAKFTLVCNLDRLGFVLKRDKRHNWSEDFIARSRGVWRQTIKQCRGDKKPMFGFGPGNSAGAGCFRVCKDRIDPRRLRPTTDRADFRRLVEGIA